MTHARWALTLFLIPLALLPGWAEQDQPAEKFPAKFWKDIPEQMKVVAAGPLGGKGHEWFSAATALPDGSWLVAGNVAGPHLDLGMPARVLGQDLPAPAEPQRIPVLEKGQPKLDKQGKPMLERPSWRHEGVTGFVAHLSPDLDRVLGVHRLPWTSGTLTAVTTLPDGTVALAGRATDGIRKLGGDFEDVTIELKDARKTGSCERTFLAVLSPDLGKVRWVKHFAQPSDAPRLETTADGTIRLLAQDVRDYTADGMLRARVEVPGGVKRTNSVSPTDGSIVIGGEHHWSTGREPWRCPILNHHRPDGTLVTQMYDWGGPFVGLDNLRLVSDTAVRWVTHTPSGEILLYAWSDGGNSVATRQPLDIRTTVPHKGLGINAAGAGVLSAAYVIRIDPKTYSCSAWTIWLAFSGVNKPNSVWIDTLQPGQDGSICCVGRAALGLWQTKNRLSEADPTGEYVCVMHENLQGIRFCSIVPGAGVAEANDGSGGKSTSWGIATSQTKNRQRVLFVGSANGETAPIVRGPQAKISGGWCDGYLVLVEGEPTQPTAQPAPARSEGTPIAFERGAPGKKPGEKAAMPPSVTFNIKADLPKWVTVDAEFRDHGEKLLPSFLYGKPVEGTFKEPAGGPVANFTVACTTAPQNRGDQSRKVLSELYQGDKTPEVRISIAKLSEPRKLEVKGTDKQGKPTVKTIDYCEAQGTLEIAGKKVTVQPRLTHSYGKTSGVWRGPGKIDMPVDSVRIQAWLTVKAGDLGLKALPADTPVDVRIGLSGLAPVPEK